MLNGKVYGRSQWFLSLDSAASGLEKPLLAGYVFGGLNVSIATDTAIFFYCGPQL